MFGRCNRNDYLETVIKEAVKAEEVTQRIHKGQGKCLLGSLFCEKISLEKLKSISLLCLKAAS